jgi:hypothetical protein
MFVRFRQQALNRLSVSIVHSQRVGGRLKHDHIAALGSVEMPPSFADRIAFWQRVNQRLAKLSNRIDATAQAKIRGAIHQRIPMPTTDGQRALQRENFEAEERLWDGMHGMHAENVENLKALAATIEKQIADGQTAMAKTAAARDAAKEKRARLDSGEDVLDGLGKRVTQEDLINAFGLSPSDVRHMQRLAELREDGEWEEFMDEVMKRKRAAEKAASRAVLRRKNKDVCEGEI